MKEKIKLRDWKNTDLGTVVVICLVIVGLGALFGFAVGLIDFLSGWIFSSHSRGYDFLGHIKKGVVLAVTLPIIPILMIFGLNAFFNLMFIWHKLTLNIIKSRGHQVNKVENMTTIKNFENLSTFQLILVLCKKVAVFISCFGIMSLLASVIDYFVIDIHYSVAYNLQTALNFIASLATFVFFLLAIYFIVLPFNAESKGDFFAEKRKEWPLTIRAVLICISVIFLVLGVSMRATLD